MWAQVRFLPGLFFVASPLCYLGEESMSPEPIDPVRAVAGEIQREVSQLRWLRDCVKQFLDEQNPRLADVQPEVYTILALTPVLCRALLRVSRALATEPPPTPPTRTRPTRRP